MKKNTFLLALPLSLLFCMSCNVNNPELKFSDDVPLYIVKFRNTDDMKKVIASHAITDRTHDNFDEQLGDYNFVFDNTCYKFMYDPGYYTDEDFNRMRGIAGSAPYIELSEGYLLIDWRWQDYLPVSYRYLYLNMQHIMYNSHKHFFFMNTSWEDVESLSQTWQSTDVYKPLEVDEWRTVSVQSLERYMKGAESPLSYLDTIQKTPYMDGYKANLSYKYEYVDSDCGFNETAYWRYHNGGEDEYNKYASVADSLYSVYVKGLNDLIKTNKLKKWTYEIPH